MRYLRHGISLSLVPDEITLYFEITGCPLRCKGCHSPELRDGRLGEELTRGVLDSWLAHYNVSCVCFLGGDYIGSPLPFLAQHAKDHWDVKTCLYTGQPSVSAEIKYAFDYLKTGPYVQRHGGLESPTSNQEFWDLRTGELINHKFWRANAPTNNTTTGGSIDLP
jgi:anaerobic ribonucleoside-triphosphate reductase activating protein